jgi:Domain of unknown function (DUF4157)
MRSLLHASRSPAARAMNVGQLAGARSRNAPPSMQPAAMQRPSMQRQFGNQATGTLLRASGEALPAGLRAEMEARFGQDFSAVRLHTGADAALAAQAEGAEAFTLGQDVVFGGGRYAPGTVTGRALLAHELAHVVQQSRGGPAPSGKPDNALEGAASHAAAALVGGDGPVAVAGASGVGIARQGSGLAGLSTAGKYAHTVQFRDMQAYIDSDAGGDYVLNADGSVTATVWRSYPQSALLPSRPAATAPTPARKPPPTKIAPEQPADIHKLMDVVEAMQPRLIYPKPVRQFFGSLQFLGGGLEAGIGGVGGIATAETGVGLAAGGFMLLHGADVATSGWHTMWTGEGSHTYTFRLGAGAATVAGADPKLARAVGESTDLIANIGSAGLSLHMMPSPAIALTPEAELDLELAQLANLEARPRFTVDFDLQWQDIAEGVLTPEGYRLNPRLQNLESLLTPGGKISGRNFGGVYMYVVDEQGVIRIGTRAGQHMPHPSLVGGLDPGVLAAGEIDIRAGQIYSINNLSGHFRPSPQSLGAMFEAFSRLPDTAFRPGFLGLRAFHF